MIFDDNLLLYVTRQFISYEDSAERFSKVFGEILLIVFIITALSCLFRGIYETFKLDVSFSIIGKGSKSIKIILLSDLHARYFNVSLNRLISVIEKSGADVILFAGDFTNGGTIKEKNRAAKIISRIAVTATSQGIPFYAVSGNHDIYGILEMLDGIDVRVLSNESAIVRSKDGSFWKILGLEDLKRGCPDYEKAKQAVTPDSIRLYENSRKNIDNTQQNDFHLITSEILIDPDRPDVQEYLPEIILAHNPDTIFMLPTDDNVISDIELIASDSSISRPSSYHPNVASASRFLLSGHFHGGQIWMPFDLEYKLLRKEKMARLGYRKGAYEYLGFKGYISRGLGCVIVPLRFFSYPEISVLELRAD